MTPVKPSSNIAGEILVLVLSCFTSYLYFFADRDIKIEKYSFKPVQDTDTSSIEFGSTEVIYLRLLHTGYQKDSYLILQSIILLLTHWVTKGLFEEK